MEMRVSAFVLTCAILQVTSGFKILMPGDLPTVFNVVDDSPPAGSVSYPTEPKETRHSLSFGSDDSMDVTVMEEPECALRHGTIVFNGTCQRLLTQSTCSEGEWLVKMKDADGAECVARPCPQGQLFFDDRCVNLTDEGACGEGQMFYVDLTGLVDCDCEPNYFYDPWKGQCFTQHDQGSCDFGHYLEVVNGGRVACVKNPCHMEGYLLNEETGRCYRKNYRGVCMEPFSVVFDNETMTVQCVSNSHKTIFDLPTLRACSPGSLRDLAGSCREKYRVPVENIYPSSFGSCQLGFVKDARGICRKVHKLFG